MDKIPLPLNFYIETETVNNVAGVETIPVKSSTKEVKSSSPQDKRKLEKKKNVEKRWKLEERLIYEGLTKKLPPTNRGFLMMKAMGWEEGKGLGKMQNGRLEPIPIKMHQGKDGFGWKRLIQQ